MANCEEIACANVQSAICLHCFHRLCATHILAHGTLLLNEGDELCEQVNELAEQLNVCLQQIHTAREETMDKLSIWRQNQIDKVEDKYAEKVQVIEFRKDHLTDLQNEMIQRLTKEAKQPLEYMQIRQNASSEGLQTIRQAIANIVRDSVQLELCLKDSPSQPPTSSSLVNTTMTDKSHLFNLSPQQYASNKTQYYTNSSVNQSNLRSLVYTQSSRSRKTSTVTSTKTTNVFSNQPTTMQTIFTPSSISSTSKSTSTAVASVLPTHYQVQSAASTNSRTIIKRPPIYSCKNLIKFFQNISGATNHSIEHYIVQNLNRAVHVNNMMIVLLSLFEAWHSSKSPTVFNQDILSYHINIVKEYIKGLEHQLTVIAAIQVFISSCNYDEQKSSAMMTALLQFFYDYQCITKENVLDWHKNGVYYGYTNFDKAKRWAKSFIDQLNTDIESK